jgi:hypothetical protein
LHFLNEIPHYPIKKTGKRSQRLILKLYLYTFMGSQKWPSTKAAFYRDSMVLGILSNRTGTSS